MDFERDKFNKHVDMTFDNDTMEITIHSDFLQESTRIESYNSEDDKFIISNNDPIYKKPLGELLYSFINADFKSIEGFKDYISKWGLSGLLDLADWDQRYIKVNG